MSEKRCPRCHLLTEGGHPRDGSDKCWCPSTPMIGRDLEKALEEYVDGEDMVEFLRKNGFVPLDDEAIVARDLIRKFGKPTCHVVRYDQEDGCPFECGEEQPCPKHRR